jgi:hypothetical protein
LKDGDWIDSADDATSLSRTQTRTVTSMLNDGTWQVYLTILSMNNTLLIALYRPLGIRLLKVDLCSKYV